MARRLLIPVKRAEDADHALSYVLRRRADEQAVAVCFLHVEEAPSQWETLFGGSGVHAMWHRQGQDVFTRVLSLLVGRDVEYAAYVRSGPVVFSILDAAEELDCDEIVVPAPRSGLFRLLSREIVSTLMLRQRGVPVVAVDKQGLPRATDIR